jgi:UDP-glucose 4-epimerase
MAAISGFNGEPCYAPARPGEVHRSALDPALLAATIGWSAKTPLEAGLEQTIDWVRSRALAGRRPDPASVLSTARREASAS